MRYVVACGDETLFDKLKEYSEKEYKKPAVFVAFDGEKQIREFIKELENIVVQNPNKNKYGFACGEPK